MNRRNLWLSAATTLLLAACSSENELTTPAPVPPTPVVEQAQVPVSFGTYLGRSSSTRAMTEAKTGDLTLDLLKGEDAGFGVFAYSTGSSKYPTATTDAAPQFKPNFMYNERVAWDKANSLWTYWPVKFWPNDNTTADTQGATGTTTSYVSFFAYAPYTGQDDTATDPTGDGTMTTKADRTGITAITANSASGDPKVTYKLSPSGTNVDLLWGTCNSTYNVASSTTATQTGDIVKYTGGVAGKAKVNINLTKPWVTDNSTTSTDKITFTFKHALSKVGGSQEGDASTPNGLQVKLDIDKDGNIDGGSKPDETKVTIKTIKIENDGATDMDGNTTVDANDKIPSGGTFNLATGIWTASTSEFVNLSHTIKSPATTTTGDGAEASASDPDIAEKLAEPASVTSWDAINGITGVTTTAQNVYKGSSAPLLFIPDTKPIFKVTIEYIVRTKDAKLESGYSEVAQKISKVVKLTNAVELNKKYNLVIHLGLTSVKFTATVSNWNDANGDGTVDESEKPADIAVYTPKNVKNE